MVRHDADGYQYPVNTETRLYSLHIGVGSELYPHLQLPIEATPRIMALVNFSKSSLLTFPNLGAYMF
jgi:hypothetical protein